MGIRSAVELREREAGYFGLQEHQGRMILHVEAGRAHFLQFYLQEVA
jgi:hypothetical protein